MLNTGMSLVLAFSEGKRHQPIILSHLQKSLVPLFLNNVGILFHIVMYFKFCMMPLNQKLATMSPYCMGDTLHIIQYWIIQVKPGEHAVPLKVMMVIALLLFIQFYVFTYLFLNSDWLKSLQNKQKISTLI